MLLSKEFILLCFKCKDSKIQSHCLELQDNHLGKISFSRKNFKNKNAKYLKNIFLSSERFSSLKTNSFFFANLDFAQFHQHLQKSQKLKICLFSFINILYVGAAALLIAQKIRYSAWGPWFDSQQVPGLFWITSSTFFLIISIVKSIL